MAKVIHGDASNEQLIVTTDKTQVYGLSGNDTLISSGNSSVLLIGGSGDDSLVMMGGNGTLNGGAGKDTFELTYSAVNSLSAVIEDFNPSDDKIVVNFDGAFAPQLHSIKGDDGDVVWTDSGNFNLTIKSKRENDYFDGDASKQVWEVLEITNEKREAQGLSALTLSDGLMIGAMSRAQEIAYLDEQGIFKEYEHTRPDGTKYFTVLVGENLSLSAKYFGYAENLQAGAATSEEVMDAWMNSPTHQKNILDNQDEEPIHSRKLGVGYNYVAVGSTSSHDRFWTQLFADSLQSPETVSLDNLSVATVNTVSTAVTLDDNDNDYANTLNGATIAALDGNDSISNTGVFVSIAGGSGADTIDNIGANATICAGAGDDSIQLGGANNFIEFLAGDGSDIVYGFRADSTLSIAGDEYMPVTVGNDVIVAVGDDSITLANAATLSTVNIIGTRSKLYILTDDDDEIENSIEGATIQALGGDDNVVNTSKAVTIDAGDGDDYIDNQRELEWNEETEEYETIFSADSVSIDGGAGNDTVTNSGDFVTISAGKDNDSLVNNGGASVLFVYDSGSDTISGFNETSTLRVSDGDYSSIAIGNDLILVGATDSIKVLNAAGLSTFNIVDANGEHVTVGDAKNRIGTEGNDAINNPINNATIQALGGDDTITNIGANVSINAGGGNDSIDNSGSQVTIEGGEGNDSIDNKSSRVTINSGAGDDSISNSKANVTINAGEGSDYIANDSASVTIDAGAGDNTITSNGRKVSIVSGNGNDFINSSGDSVTVDGGSGDDTIHNSSNRVSIVSGDGNDSVNNEGSRVTIRTGAGDDTITNSGNAVAIHYGGGNDIVEGFNETSTLNLGSYAWQTVKGDAAVLVYVTSNDETIGTIMLKDYSGEKVNIKSTWKPSSDKGTVIANYTSDTIVTGDDGDDTIDNQADNVTIIAGNGDDSISNGTVGSSVVSSNVSISGGGGNDDIVNYSDSVTIDAGSGNDNIDNRGNNVTIEGGTGDDTISNSNFSSNSNSVTIDAGAGDDSITNYGASVSISGGTGDDTISNSNFSSNSNSVTIDAGEGDDSITNYGASVSISGGADDDTVANSGSQVTIDAGAGNDSIGNSGKYVSIVSGDGKNSISNASVGTGSTIVVGNDNDSIRNEGSSVSIVAGSGNDYVYNGDINSAFTKYTTILGGDGADTVYNLGDYSFIDLGDGNDSIYSFDDCITLDAGNGDDTIEGASRASSINAGAGNDRISLSSRVSLSSGVASGFNTATTIDGGAGDDTIQNGYDSLHGGGSNVTILGGTGNDRISLSADSKNNFVRYSLGDGNDTVWGINEDDTLNFLADKSLVSSLRSGNDIVFNVVGSGEILLVDAWDKPPKVTHGESGHSGGGSGSGGDGGGGSSGGNGDGGNGSGKDNSSGGISTDANKGDRDASGNQSASGSAGRGSIGRGTSTGLGRGGGNNDSSDSANNTTNSYNYYYDNKISVTPFASPFDALKTPAANQYVYTGNNMVIDTYKAGEKIFFLTDYTGYFSDNAGNLFFGSSTGALVVQNATDKFIDNYDAAGNPFLKAYTATTAGVIDGRWQAGFEVLNGSSGADAIYAGDGGSQLWGGADNAADTLVGGAGADIFIGGKAQGADVILNASSADVVNLNDATLSDIVATAEDNGAITLAFNTGNAIAVQSSEAQSATFQLADGSAYRFNHATKTWQNANQHVYAGGNQVINNYQAGEKILFNATYTGATFDDAGNFLVGSSTGALAVTNATDKVIDLRDVMGNDFVKAYAATTAGVIDGRGLAGFEVINGSAGSDAIFAGNGGSQLWGGADNAADTLIGGAGADIFISGKAQGADVILNASSTDVVHLNDATLSDIIGTTENDGAITLAFNTGNAIAVQSSEVQSATFLLADGSAYRYNHVAKSWQTA